QRSDGNDLCIALLFDGYMLGCESIAEDLGMNVARQLHASVLPDFGSDRQIGRLGQQASAQPRHGNDHGSISSPPGKAYEMISLFTSSGQRNIFAFQKQ